MHKGVILLVKAEDKEDALDKTRDFLERYGDGDVWDWYQIGGRWTNTLAPFKKEWKEACDTILTPDEHGWLTQSQIDKKQTELQFAWALLGLQGLNPYTNHYNLPEDGGFYDVIDLKDCVDTVKNWVVENRSEEDLEKLLQAIEEEKADPTKYKMSAYYARIYADALDSRFSFESNVYDITEDTGEKVPEDIEGYWAVVVDMHN